MMKALILEIPPSLSMRCTDFSHFMLPMLLTQCTATRFECTLQSPWKCHTMAVGYRIFYVVATPDLNPLAHEVIILV